MTEENARFLAQHMEKWELVLWLSNTSDYAQKLSKRISELEEKSVRD